MDVSNNIFLPEYIDDNDKDSAHFFMDMLLKALPLKNEQKLGVIDNIDVVLTYNKTNLKREADFKIKHSGTFFSSKFLHSKLHHYNNLEVNWLVAFILNHKTEIENFIG